MFYGKPGSAPLRFTVWPICETALIAPLRSVRIQFHLAPIALYDPSEYYVAAFRAHMAGRFILNPFFSADFSPVWNGPQYDLFADRHWKIFNMSAGKFSALMASGKTLPLPPGSLMSRIAHA